MKFGLQGDYGDISDRVRLRQSLDCKSFRWYLNEVYPELYNPDDDLVHGVVSTFFFADVEVHGLKAAINAGTFLFLLRRFVTKAWVEIYVWTRRRLTCHCTLWCATKGVEINSGVIPDMDRFVGMTCVLITLMEQSL